MPVSVAGQADTLSNMIADGDRVAYVSTMTGTQTGPMGRFPATGKTFTLVNIIMQRLKDGKVVETWVSWGLCCDRIIRALGRAWIKPRSQVSHAIPPQPARCSISALSRRNYFEVRPTGAPPGRSNEFVMDVLMGRSYPTGRPRALWATIKHGIKKELTARRY